LEKFWLISCIISIKDMKQLISIIICYCVFWATNSPVSAQPSIEWQRSLGEVYGSGTCLIKTSDGGYLYAGQTSYYSDSLDVIIAKLNSEGIPQWQRGTVEKAITMFGRSFKLTMVEFFLLGPVIVVTPI
jgi:hypothetical protein